MKVRYGLRNASWAKTSLYLLSAQAQVAQQQGVMVGELAGSAQADGRCSLLRCNPYPGPSTAGNRWRRPFRHAYDRKSKIFTVPRASRRIHGKLRSSGRNTRGRAWLLRFAVSYRMLSSVDGLVASDTLRL